VDPITIDPTNAVAPSSIPMRDPERRRTGLVSIVVDMIPPGLAAK
jgi:hypothetical protein